LNYSKTWHNISATFAIYNNTINNAIQIIETDPVNNETTTIPENLNYTITTGLELIGHFNLLKGWDLTANANIFNRNNAAAPQYGIRANHGSAGMQTSRPTTLKRLSPTMQIIAHRTRFCTPKSAEFGMDAGAFGFAGNRLRFKCH
jgi:outer membrane cobalamin receptor